MNVPPEQKSNQNKTNSNETKINKRKGKLPTKSRDNNKSKKIQETKKFTKEMLSTPLQLHLSFKMKLVEQSKKKIFFTKSWKVKI